jgi:putative transposase
MYLDLLREWAPRCGMRVWCYCLMPNHVHLIVVPETPGALARCLGEVHRRYTKIINSREGWIGYLWQGRFSSFPMDEGYTVAAARYVLTNPLRAGLVMAIDQWPFSSISVHLRRAGDGIVDRAGLDALVGDWSALLCQDGNPARRALRKHERSGLPLGSDAFITRLESTVGRQLRPAPTGRPRRKAAV